ncbi:MAG TPA: hypothetical protein VLM85_00700, partial [Polyangiaceae bacterium]|nr:hypothetical protein [Polyangiaceae bacterium]
GSGACPPAGDLRAPKASLLAATNAVVPVRGQSRGAWDAETLLGWEGLKELRIGLVTSVARPHRVVALLRRNGVEPARVVFGPDHGPLPPFGADREIDLWLTTGKDWALLGCVRAARIDYHLRLPPERLAQLEAGFPALPRGPAFLIS